MESPPTKTAPNLEDSGCVVDGLRIALSDGDMEDENSMMVRFICGIYTVLFITIDVQFQILQLFMFLARGTNTKALARALKQT